MEKSLTSRKNPLVIETKKALHLLSLTAAVIILSSISIHAVLIDFEDIETSGTGTGGQAVIENQYRDLGIIFNRPVALDYSRDLGIDSYAHSPSQAVETCYSEEFCDTPLEMAFAVPVKYLKLWVGAGQGTSYSRTVRLQAYSRNGRLLDSDERTIMPTDSIIPISIPLEVTSISEPIHRAEVGYLPSENNLVDNAGLAVDDVQFEVNEKPELELSVSPAATLPVGETFVFSARARDPENMPLQYSFFLDRNRVSEPSPSNTWSWTPDSGDVGSHTIEARASDEVQYGSDQVRIAVRSNSLPSISSLQMSPESPHTGSPVTFTVQASDAEGDTMQYAFRLDGRLAKDWSRSRSFSWTPSEDDAGEHTMQAIVRDDNHREDEDWGSKTLSFSVQSEGDPRMESISIIPEEIRIGSPAKFAAEASDPEGDTLQYMFLLDGRQVRSWAESPNWSWTPSKDDSGDHVIAVRVRDSRGRTPQAADDEMQMSFQVPADQPSPPYLVPLILAGGSAAAFILARRIMSRRKDRKKEDRGKKGPDAAKASFKACSGSGTSGIWPPDGLAALAEISFRVVPGKADAQFIGSMLDVIGEEMV